MIASFFQSLESNRVDYLLISGQAAVLYGAAAFSEDIDLWIEPSATNIDRFIKVLCDHNAVYYKLTPPLQPQHLQNGHGFHFLFPDESGEDVYLDVMGVPPRISDFATAQGHAELLDSEWGPLRTIGIKHLVELKKTQRLQDYAVISNLVLRYFERDRGNIAEDDYVWGLNNLFGLSALSQFLKTYPTAADVSSTKVPTPIRRFAKAVVAEDVRPSIEDEANRDISDRIAALQAKDRNYWRAIIGQLRELRAQGKLVEERTRVSPNSPR